MKTIILYEYQNIQSNDICVYTEERNDNEEILIQTIEAVKSAVKEYIGDDGPSKVNDNIMVCNLKEWFKVTNIIETFEN